MKKQNPQQSQMSVEQTQIANYLKKLRFRRRLFGVDQADVWKKIEELNALYETALQAEQMRYDRMLAVLCGDAPESAPDSRDGREGAVYDES